MRTVSDYKGEEAIELLADIVEPLALILADKEIQKLQQSGAPKLKFIKPALTRHKPEVMEILARIEGVPVEEYKDKVSFTTLPIQILTLLGDPQVSELFSLQGQKTDSQSSGPATEDIKDKEN